MTIQPQTLKGFRDFLPSDALKRQYVIGKIREVFVRFGFQPIETPALEYLETFTGNIGADEKLFFKFTDQGDRNVALRYDQTVPSCRFVAQYKNEIVFPFKRYQIQTVWRSEKPQKGRYREFLQCDADIFGIEGPEADAEVIALTLDLYKSLGFKDYIVKVNDRAIFKDVKYEVIVAVDKLAKIGSDNVIKEIEKAGYSEAEAKQLFDSVINAKPTETINTIFTYLKALGYDEANYIFDPTIARSFNYSTGPIWEVIIPGFSGGSVLGGERYDKLMGRFQKEDVPATGFAVGFDRTLEAMEELGILPTLLPSAKVLVTVFSKDLMPQSIKVARYLRENNISTDIYLQNQYKLDKQIKYADKLQIPFVMIIGDEEVQKNTVTIKIMATREQKEMSLQEAVTFLT